MPIEYRRRETETVWEFKLTDVGLCATSEGGTMMFRPTRCRVTESTVSGPAVPDLTFEPFIRVMGAMWQEETQKFAGCATRSDWYGPDTPGFLLEVLQACGKQTYLRFLEGKSK